MTPNVIFGLPLFNDLFGYLPVDIINFILVVLMILIVLAIRRVIY